MQLPTYTDNGDALLLIPRKILVPSEKDWKNVARNKDSITSLALSEMIRWWYIYHLLFVWLVFDEDGLSAVKALQQRESLLWGQLKGIQGNIVVLFNKIKMSNDLYAHFKHTH